MGGSGPNVEDIGTDIDFIRIHKNEGGNQIQDIHWRVRRNDVEISYSDSIYTPAFDTTLLEIFY